MDIYLVDFENVKNNGLIGADTLMEEDKLIVFYSENADKITFEVHELLCRIRAQVQFFKVTVGVKNALDLQLASYLGKLIEQFPQARFYIITSDKVFLHLQNFWDQVSIEIQESIGPHDNKERNELLEKIQDSLPEDEEHWEEISLCILKYKTKQAINNALVKKFGSTQGGRMYQKIKPILKNKK